MIGRDMNGWTDVELQRVADAERIADASEMDDVGDYGIWTVCLQGVRCAGGGALARHLDVTGPAVHGHPANVRKHFPGFRRRIPISERFDELCRRHGNERIVRLIRERARAILASRTLAQYPHPESAKEGV